jgi:ADP-L-glycero-D-manno-heptose 6-epimerase
MASMIYKMYKEIKETGKVNLFKSHKPEYGDGEQIRDFIYIDDVVDTLLWFYDNHPNEHGIYNLGTGIGRTFNEAANIIFNTLNIEPDISYFDMPENIRDQYQYYTEAPMEKLRGIGFDKEFNTLESGIQKYCEILNGSLI